jgi:hypothetical protein
MGSFEANFPQDVNGSGAVPSVKNYTEWRLTAILLRRNELSPYENAYFIYRAGREIAIKWELLVGANDVVMHPEPEHDVYHLRCL